jgi:hypothetical protein
MREIKLACILSIYLSNKIDKTQSGGGNYRKIVVNGTDSELESFLFYAEKYKKELEERNVKIFYKRTPKRKPKFFIELYGYDGELKKTFYKKDLDEILESIDSMPMGKIEKNIRKIII